MENFDKKQLRLLVRAILKESFESVEESKGSHGDAKEMKKAIKWIKSNLEGIRVEDTKDGQKVCPPEEKSEECYTIHKGGKGRYDLYRFLAKAYNVSKHEIESAIGANRALNLLSINTDDLEDLKTINLSGKDWYIDEKNQQLIMVKNIRKTKDFDSLSIEDYEKVLETI